MTRLPIPDEAAARFLRGLTIGALIGAVVAGSSMWSRRVARRLEIGDDHDSRGQEDQRTPGPQAVTRPD